MRYTLLGLVAGSVACATAPAVTYETAAEFAPHAAAARAKAFADAAAHPHHGWRDEAHQTPEGRLRAMVEIGAGDRDKREFSMADNALVLDRVLPEAIEGYPVNYGFIPRTIAFDGDPLDVLVLGPRLEPGTWVEGKALAVLHMRDEKGEDPKVVISPVDEAGQPRFELRPAEQARIADWFVHYKGLDPERFAEVYGWGDETAAARLLEVGRAYFDEGRSDADRGAQ